MVIPFSHSTLNYVIHFANHSNNMPSVDPKCLMYVVAWSVLTPGGVSCPLVVCRSESGRRWLSAVEQQDLCLAGFSVSQCDVHTALDQLQTAHSQAISAPKVSHLHYIGQFF